MDPLDTWLKPEFPKESVDQNSYRAELEYVGPTSTFTNAAIRLGQPWGDYNGVVAEMKMVPTEYPSYSTFYVTIERKFGQVDNPSNQGTKQETNEEIDWIAVDRSLYEHPDFTTGSHALTDADVMDIKAWQAETDITVKKQYKYNIKSGSGETTTSDLSANAKHFAIGINKGCERWTDYIPVLRNSQTYKNGPGPVTGAGFKQDPSGFQGIKPDGYEWLRSAQRCVRRGGQNSWALDTEWTGCYKVLIDKDKTYW